MVTSSSQSIYLAKPGCVCSLAMSSPSRSFHTRKSSVLTPSRIQCVVFIVGAILLYMGEASPLHTRRRRRARVLAIDSDPLPVPAGKGSGVSNGGKGGKGALFDIDTSERWDGSGDYFSLAPVTVDERLSEPPGLSPPFDTEFLTPTGSPSSTSFSDAPSLSPTKASSDAPSLGPSTFMLDTSTRLSLAPSSVQVSTGATARPSSESPVQPTSPTTVSVNFPTASPTPSKTGNSNPSGQTGNGQTGQGTDDAGPGAGGPDPEDGSDWRNMTSDSTVMCPGFTPSRLEVVTWKYSVTMKSTNATLDDADSAVQSLEPLLMDNLLGLLECGNLTGRRLTADFGLVGMDYLPDDLPEGECASTGKRPCFVYQGQMFIFLDENADTDTAVFETRKTIKLLMSDVNNFPIPTVKRVKYLAPDLSDPDAIQKPQTPQANTVQTGGNGSSPAVPILSAMGGLVVVIALVATYRMRRKGTENVDGPSTVADTSTFAATHASLSKSPGRVSASPFSGILPHGYQTTEEYPMGAILEEASESASYSRTSEIIVSDCSYTDEESSRDHSFQQNMFHDDNSILGARGMDESEADDDVLFDETESTSSKRKVSFIGEGEGEV